ncbi:lytic transglycosylase domain-containing protein [Pleomorphomonas sp. NRK KF1]|uniref:lytic transglycosylase domain-containing protein n=1 Tax=Pleomorphomonas sp. NRK KF1 TaxID=2943000 RepID=UPI00204330D3|nr:lytic transglycosylase domain-containing protein [Pleomorphomonas sp. NRK KF1]MCM5552081.1 lytic transglycosylase domain-containing protein [Pleomorphomonas sp. NRK KF1]
MFKTPSLVAALLIALPAMLSEPSSALAAGPSADITGALPNLSQTNIDGLRSALDALDSKNLAGALSIAANLSEIDRDIVTWMAIRRGVEGLTPGTITDFARRRPDWPSVELMRRRAEQALSDMNLSPADEIAAYAGSAPISDKGTKSLARALIAAGRNSDASALLGAWWARERLSPAEDKATIAEFGGVLTRAQHKARYDMLMYADRVTQAAALAPYLPNGYAALAAARTAVLRGSSDAGRKLDAVPKAARKDPLYAFTLAEWHRRADRPEQAAKVILSVDAKATALHGDDWWVERRIVSRDLMEKNNHRLAYKVVANHAGGGETTLQEAYFHAGWYALRFLKDPQAALRHFGQLEKVSQKPISRARANYWMARAEEAAGRTENARTRYGRAASDEFTFYGQLARVKLGLPSLGLPPAPKPTEADRAAFARTDLARVLVQLLRTGRESDANLLYLELAKTLTTGGQVALLAGFAESQGDHRLALQIGKLAADRGLGAERLAFPLDAIPESARHQKQVETAMVYGIARQESAFDPRARSKAGALGLLQLIPSTAANTAKAIGVKYSKDRLTSDAGYNATLGAAHLRELLDEFGGSYILTFAAYNAGKSRVREWVQRFGDPRNPGVDPVDWIESIPYGETRNYVQRVLENIQVYRERLDGARLAIADDLRRGS